MGRPARLLDWSGPSEAAQLRARVLALKVELAEAEDRLYALQTAPAPAPSAPPPTAWLTPEAASARYGWKAQTLRYWARTGKLRASRSTGRVLVSTQDLDAMQAPRATGEE